MADTDTSTDTSGNGTSDISSIADAKAAVFAQAEGSPLKTATSNTAPDEASTAVSSKVPVPAEVDTAALIAAIQRGDVDEIEKLASLPKGSTKITDSRWAQFRRETRESRRQLDARRQQTEAKEREIAAKYQQIEEANRSLLKAAQHLQSGDLVSFIEASTGQKIEDVLRDITEQTLDPSLKESRSLKRQMQQEREEREKRDADARREADARGKQQAEISYINRSIVAPLQKDPEFAAFFEDHQLADLLVRDVFQIQKDNWDPTTESTIDAVSAARQVIQQFKSDYTRWNKLFAGGGSSSHDDDHHTSSNTRQSARSARTSAREKGPAKKETPLRRSDDFLGDKASLKQKLAAALDQEFASRRRV